MNPSHSDPPPSDPGEPPASNGDSAPVDRSVESLLAECLALTESRWSQAISEACRDRADLAQPLLQLFRTVRDMDAVLRPVATRSAESDHIPSGSVLGDFEVLECVGGGGMGVVYRARQLSLNRTVALKVIRPEHLFFDKAKERFRRETEAVSRLHHAGIVPLYEAGEERGLPYFTMEFIEGQSLGAILNSLRFRDASRLRASDFVRAYRQGATGEPTALDEGVFSSLEKQAWPSLCCRIVARVAHALEHAHKNGVVHRDIKPSNLMVKSDGGVVVVDFGLAISDGASSLTRTGSHPGSLPYMSPEQLSGEPLDHRSDIYSLGVTLYELLTLRCPFPLSNPELARKHISTGAFDRPRSRNRSISLEIEAVCLKAMDSDPARRYPSASAFAEDLVNAVFHRPLVAQRFSLGRRLLRLSQRHPARTLATVSLFLAFVVGPLLFALREHSHAEELRKERALAQVSANRAIAAAQESEQTSRFLSDVLASADPMIGGTADISVRQMLDRSLSMIDDRLSPSVRAHISLVLGRTYRNLGVRDKAKYLLTQALELYLTSDPENVEVPQAMIEGSFARQWDGDLVGASGLVHRALTRLDQYCDGTVPIMMIPALVRLAEIQSRQGNFKECTNSLEKAFVRLGHLSEPVSPRAECRASVGLRVVLADALLQLGDVRRPAELLRDVEVSPGVSADPALEARVTQTLMRFALATNAFDRANMYADKLVTIGSKVFGSNSGIVLDAKIVIACLRTIRGDVTAVRDAREAIANLERAAGVDSEAYVTDAMLFTTALISAGRLQEAKKTCSAVALSIKRSATCSEFSLRRVELQLARILTASGDLAEAIDVLMPAIAFFERSGCTGRMVAEPMFRLAECYLARSEQVAAIPVLRRAELALRTAGDCQSLLSTQVRLRLGASLVRLGHNTEGAWVLSQLKGELQARENFYNERFECSRELALSFWRGGMMKEGIQESLGAMTLQAEAKGRVLYVNALRLAADTLEVLTVSGQAPSDDIKQFVNQFEAGTRGTKISLGSYVSALCQLNSANVDVAREALVDASRSLIDGREDLISASGITPVLLSRVLIDAGHWGEAEELCGLALRQAEAMGQRDGWIAQLARLNLVAILDHAGEPGRAQELVEEVKDTIDALGPEARPIVVHQLRMVEDRGAETKHDPDSRRSGSEK